MSNWCLKYCLGTIHIVRTGQWGEGGSAKIVLNSTRGEGGSGKIVCTFYWTEGPLEIIFFQAFTKNPSILSKQGRRKVVYSIQEIHM